jgi:hypothetical protein
LDISCGDVTFANINQKILNFYTMRKIILIFTMLTFVSFLGMSQTQLTWRFARPQVIAGTPDIFQFDVEVKADAAGTFQRDLQVYFDYNTLAFGNDIVANGKVSVSNLTLMDNFYFVVNSADNTSSKFAVITEATNEMSQSGSLTYFNEVSTTFTGFLRFQIEIADANELAGISFDQALMDGGQYMQSVSNTDPVAYVNPSLYENNLVNSSLKGLQFSINCFLEGPYDIGTGSMMNTDLLSGGYLPFNQPFNPSLPYYDNSSPEWLYGGTESVGAFPANTVDWILVQLRDADVPANATSATIIASSPAFLLNDGTVVGLDGNAFVMKQAYSQNLFVVIYQRNHLAIMSNYSIGLNASGNYIYDFTDDVNKAFGGSIGFKDMGDGVFGLVSSDINANGLIQTSDKTNGWIIELGFSGYLGSDINLNGLTQNDDITNYWFNNLGGGGQVPGKTTSEYASQVPK